MNDNLPTDTPLLSLAISLMLTSAFLSTAPEGIIPAAAGPTAPSQAIARALDRLQASGWHGAAELPAPASASIPTSAAANDDATQLPPPITEAQLQKVLAILAQRGLENNLKAKYAVPLRLSKNGEKVRIRQLGIEDENAIQYAIALLKDGRGYVLDKGPRVGNRVGFHLDANFKVVTAISITSADEITTLSAAEAEARLREVLATWAEYSDQASY